MDALGSNAMSVHLKTWAFEPLKTQRGERGRPADQKTFEATSVALWVFTRRLLHKQNRATVIWGKILLCSSPSQSSLAAVCVCETTPATSQMLLVVYCYWQLLWESSSPSFVLFCSVSPASGRSSNLLRRRKFVDVLIYKQSSKAVCELEIWKTKTTYEHFPPRLINMYFKVCCLK